MDFFAEMNVVYATYFGTSPPARACIAVDLPGDNRVKLDCVAYNGPERHALHVQGISYWAPANIGPYSQAIKVRMLPYHIIPKADMLQGKREGIHLWTNRHDTL